MYSRKYVCMFIYLFIFNDVTICKNECLVSINNNDFKNVKGFI